MFIAIPCTPVGNPNLKEEESDATTIGIVFTPSWAGNLSVSVDYFDIKVKDFIGGMTYYVRAASSAVLRATLMPRGAPCAR